MRRALLLLLAGGCFSPNLGNGMLQCGAGGACPEGLVCHADNHCYTSPGGNIDASVTIDSAPGTPDAMIDSGSAGPQPTIHYAFDNSTVNTGTMSNANGTLISATYVTGKFGQALHFGSTGAYATVPNSATILGAGSTNYTVSLWFRQNGTDTPLLFSDENRSTAPYGGVQLYMGTSTSVVECSSNATLQYIEGSCQGLTGTPATSAWHSLVVEYNNSTLVFYLDGVAAHTVTGAAGCFNASVYDPITFGGSGANLDIDEFKIYTQVFSAAQRCTVVIGGTYAASTCTLP